MRSSEFQLRPLQIALTTSWLCGFRDLHVSVSPDWLGCQRGGFPAWLRGWLGTPNAVCHVRMVMKQPRKILDALIPCAEMLAALPRNVGVSLSDTNKTWNGSINWSTVPQDYSFWQFVKWFWSCYTCKCGWTDVKKLTLQHYLRTRLKTNRELPVSSIPLCVGLLCERVFFKNRWNCTEKFEYCIFHHLF